MQVEVDREGCIGCGVCAEICPSVFRLDEEGLSTPYAEPNEENHDAVKDAADSCPVDVIHVKD